MMMEYTSSQSFSILTLLCIPSSQVFAVAWAGSQVTKPFRVGGAIVSAPAASRFMTWFQERLGLQNKSDTVPLLFALLVLLCGSVFGGLILQGTLSEALKASLLEAEWATSLILVPFIQRKSLALGPPPSSSPSSSIIPGLLSSSSAINNRSPQGTISLSTQVAADSISTSSAVELSSSRAASSALPDKKIKPKRRPKNLVMPPNPNIHGWDQHPAYLRGKWNMTSLNVTSSDYPELIEGMR